MGKAFTQANILKLELSVIVFHCSPNKYIYIERERGKKNLNKNKYNLQNTNLNATAFENNLLVVFKQASYFGQK